MRHNFQVEDSQAPTAPEVRVIVDSAALLAGHHQVPGHTQLEGTV